MNKKTRRQIQTHITAMIKRQLQANRKKTDDETIIYARTCGFLSAIIEFAILELAEFNPKKAFELANWDLYRQLKL